MDEDTEDDELDDAELETDEDRLELTELLDEEETEELELDENELLLDREAVI